MRKLILVLTVVFTIISFIWSGIRINKGYDFKNNCTGHLKRAADANTVELAKKELNVAITYLEKRSFTTGTVSIFLQQPKNDIGFWYENLKASKLELESIKVDATQLEKTNVLMKLRETLLDNDSITYPEGISIYPNNVVFFWWGLLSWLICVVGWFALLFMWTEGY